MFLADTPLISACPTLASIPEPNATYPAYGPFTPQAGIEITLIFLFIA